jgi:peptide/nickel transport system permease protein
MSATLQKDFAAASDLTQSAAPKSLRMPLDVKLAATVLALAVMTALFASVIAPHGYATQNLAVRLQPPVFLGGSWQYPLGVDNLGRDVLSRLIYGMRTSILIAFGATLIGAAIGITLGLLAARFRGWIEDAVLLLVDVQAALPSVILALAALAFFGNNLWLFILLVGLEGWERYARLTRGLAIAAREAGYVQALEGLGASSSRIYLRHIMPNIASALIVQATLNFPGTVLLETSLSFLGLGVQPPMTSLGLMLGQGRLYLLNAWWIAVFPGLTIFAVTLSMSIFGDWLRDRFDPALRG